nr:3'-5' exonuclease [Thiomicrorhabdus cannonii]
MAGVLSAWRKKRQFKRLRDPRYAFLFTGEAETDTYICFDCETTGLNPKEDRIVSLSAIKIRGNQVLTSEALNLLIPQDAAISAESIVVHRIRNADLHSAALGDEEGNVEVLPEREAIGRFLEFIGAHPLVGYYLEFDVAMVNQVVKPWLGVELPNRRIEVSELYYRQRLSELEHGLAMPNIDLKFETILQRLQIPNIGQHDAFSDALMTALIFLKLQSLVKSS